MERFKWGRTKYIIIGSRTPGGERQRVKLAQNIKKKGNIYILDEPTTGIHMADVEKVVDILDSSVDRKNTITAKYLRK